MYINVLTVITIILYSLCVIVKQMFSGYVFHYDLNHTLVFPKPDKYIQINTWAFPYWPGYYREIPILARDGVEGQLWVEG